MTHDDTTAGTRDHNRRADSSQNSPAVERIHALNERRWILTLTGAELTVLDNALGRATLSNSPAARGLVEKVRERAAEHYRAREDAYTDMRL